MKFLYIALFLTLLGSAFAKKFTEDLLGPNDKECIKELGMETQTILDAVDDDFVTVEGNDDINKFTECTFKKVNVIDENNVIDFNILKSILAEWCTSIRPDLDNKKTAEDAVVFCQNTQGTDIGDQLVKVINCFAKYAKNVV